MQARPPTRAQQVVLQNVHSDVGHAHRVEDLHHRVAEAAHGQLLGALDESHHLRRGVVGLLLAGGLAGCGEHSQGGSLGGGWRRRACSRTRRLAPPAAGRPRQRACLVLIDELVDGGAQLGGEARAGGAGGHGGCSQGTQRGTVLRPCQRPGPRRPPSTSAAAWIAANLEHYLPTRTWAHLRPHGRPPPLLPAGWASCTPLLEPPVRPAGRQARGERQLHDDQGVVRGWSGAGGLARWAWALVVIRGTGGGRKNLLQVLQQGGNAGPKLATKSVCVWEARVGNANHPALPRPICAQRRPQLSNRWFRAPPQGTSPPGAAAAAMQPSCLLAAEAPAALGRPSPNKLRLAWPASGRARQQQQHRRGVVSQALGSRDEDDLAGVSRRGSAAGPLRVFSPLQEEVQLSTAGLEELVGASVLGSLDPSDSAVSISTIMAPVAADMETMRQNLRTVVGQRHPLLLAAADQIFSAGGKRLRPLLCLLVARATYPLSGLRCEAGAGARAGAASGVCVAGWVGWGRCGRA